MQFVLWIVGVLCVFVFLERSFPARNVRGTTRCLATVLSLIAIEVALLVATRPLAQHASDAWSVFDLSNLPDFIGGFIAYVFGTLIVYVWHRARDQSVWLWRIFHQLHHSTSSMQAITTFYRHPAEIVANTLVGTVICFLLFGLSISGAMVYGVLMVSVQIFYHANISTPFWVGYFIQRPEMHRIHHMSGYHQNNYGDLAIWDLVFGTWQNPQTDVSHVGFDKVSEMKVIEMLRFDDVS